MVGFTRDPQNTIAPCNGINHTDAGEIGTCDGCMAPVAKRQDGKVFDLIYSGMYGARKIQCYRPAHRCNPEIATQAAAERATKLAAGTILKGATVEVYKGRKIPLGTRGTVFWMGLDSYGKAKLGIKSEAGETIWVAESNCRVVH